VNGSGYPLRPFLPGDTMALRELFAASVEELTQEDYDEDQRAAWVACAEDADAFRERLEQATALVVEIEGEHAGFGSLKDNSVLDMLYVHPYHAGEGIEASETAVMFFEERGYVALQRNSVERFGEWLMTTTMTKKLKDKPAGDVS
jgi:putative acetyltransferase